jgi:peptidoglycan/LPS O-acetylase OafA/YrhL
MATRDRIPRDISQRLDVLKILLVFGVVMLHAERVITAYLPDPPLALRIVTNFFGQNLFLACVPIYFAISGYLFALSCPRTPGEYARMLWKKFLGIGVPYLFCNSAAVVIILLFRKIPYTGDFHTLDERGIVSLITGIGCMPIIAPLWFLRDLLVMYALAPAFRLVAARAPAAGLAAVLVIWCLPFGDAVGQIGLRGVFFFQAGFTLAATGTSPLLGRRVVAALGAAYAALLLVGTYAGVAGVETYWVGVSRDIATVIGVPVIFALSARPGLRDNRLLLGLSPYAFFLYLLHEPTLSYLIYLARFVFVPTGFFTGIALYVGLTALTIAVVLGLGALLSRRAPTVYGVLTGFRLPARKGCPAAPQGGGG